MRVPQLDFTPTLPALLTRAVEQFGDSDHVVSPTDRLTFRDADRRSAVLARRMLAAGVGKGTRVGIVLPSSTEFVVCFLAAARIGALSMLFSSTYRPSELRTAVQTSDVQLLLCPSELFGVDYADQLETAFPQLASSGNPTLELDDAPYLRSVWMIGTAPHTRRAWSTSVAAEVSGAAMPGLADDALLRSVEERVTPSDLLLAILTSGTSAAPKAVLHTHGTAVRKVHPSSGLGLETSTPGRRVFLVMPFFWVGGPQSLLGSLHTGSSVICQPRFDADQAIDLLERERATHVAGWPTMAQAVRSHPEAQQRDLSSLEVPTNLPSQVRSSRGHSINMGMTETFGMHRDPRYFDYQVIDPDTGQRVPDGDEGEFCVRGYGLMAGLYGREREEVFDAEGWYHTGDRGYLEGGSIYFTGRYSEMIKAAGANVSPLEVEQALLALPHVAQAFVFGMPHPQRGEDVIAAVVPAVEADFDAETTRAQLRDVLSAYKVPRRIVALTPAEVATLASGKPHRREIAANVRRQLNAADSHGLS